MDYVRNKWTAFCEALGPSSAPALKAPAPPIWVSGVQYSGDISPSDKAAVGLDDDDSHFPSMSNPPKELPSEGTVPPLSPSSSSSDTTTTTTTSSSEVPVSPSSVTAKEEDQPMIKFIDVAHTTVWCSYRSHFSKLTRFHLTSDAGWGCMFRSGQMLMCNALMEYCLGRRWRIHARLPEHDASKHVAVVGAVESIIPDMQVAKSVIRLFLDHPDSPFGVHSVTSLGAQYGVRPGDWFAPTPISSVMRDLCMRFQPAGLRAYCASEGAIYLDELQLMMNTEPMKKASDAIGDACLSAARAVTQTPQAQAEGPSGFVVMIPIRLGINSIDQSYFPKIAALFHEPQFIGIVGGRPHSSLFFFASQGRHLYYLNPHYVQSTLPHPASTDSISIASYVPSRVKKVPVSELDPSMSLGFLFGSMAEFNEFERRFKDNDDINDLFSIISSRPNSGITSGPVDSSEGSFSRIIDL